MNRVEHELKNGAAGPDSDAAPLDIESTITIRGPDRRRPSLKSAFYGIFFRARRRRIRREEDADNAFLDHHPRRLLILASAILLLSVTDGLLTVRLVNAGAQEINPLLALFVHDDAAGFALAKWALTALGVITLVAAAHARVFGRLRGVTVLQGFLAAYAALVTYSSALVLLAT